MADWCRLPKDLLQEIDSRLKSPICTLRLRSTCSNWRHALISNINNQTASSLSFPSNSIMNALSKRCIIIISPLQTSVSTKPSFWIIKIEETTPKRFNLFRILSDIRVSPLPGCFPTMLDLQNIRVYDKAFEYSVHGAGIVDDCSLYTEKIAFLPAKNGGGNDFLLLSIHISGKLAIFNNVDMKWTLVDCFQSPFDDVIAYNGEFYAVDTEGRTVVLSDNNAIVVAEPGCWGDKKRLVEMCGELMLVDAQMGFSRLVSSNDHFGINRHEGDGFLSRPMRFTVYRLNRVGVKWVEVKDLGNNVLFLGAHSTFAASADELSWDKGNCICFNFKELFNVSTMNELLRINNSAGDGIYNLEDSTLSYTTLFWPPPQWIGSSS